MKAGKVIYGADLILQNRSRIHLILMSDNINRTADYNLKAYADNYCVKLIVLSVQELEEIVLKSNCKAIAVKDRNLAKAITGVWESGK